MKRVILFGATGNLGQAVAKELSQQGYDLTVVVRSIAKAKSIAHLGSKYIIAEVCNKETLKNITQNQDVVISTLGKSVSPFDLSSPSFREVDWMANVNILEEAKQNSIAKFIYVSAFDAEKYPHLDYFKTHHDFAELLKQSGINYTIIKPPAIFCAFLDMIKMARKGQLSTLGHGNKKTNPIDENDLAKIIVGAIPTSHNTTIEAGGQTIYSRKELNQIIQNEVDSSKKIWTIPMGLIKFGMPFIKIISKNTFDKIAFFVEVTQHDTIAPKMGPTTFESYVKQKTAEFKKIN